MQSIALLTILLIAGNCYAQSTTTLNTLGSTSTELVAVSSSGRNVSTSAESTLADLYCAGMLAANTPSQALTVCIINGGSFDANLAVGPITTQSLAKVYPYKDHTVVRLLISGDTLMQALAHGVKGFPINGEFPQVSNIRYAFYPAPSNTSPTGFDTAVTTAIIQANGQVFGVGGSALEVELVVNSYMADGGDNYTMLEGAEVLVNTTRTVNEVVGEYITNNTPLSLQPQGRIVNCISQGGDPLCKPNGGMALQISPAPTSFASRTAGTSFVAAVAVAVGAVLLSVLTCFEF